MIAAVKPGGCVPRGNEEGGRRGMNTASNEKARGMQPPGLTVVSYWTAVGRYVLAVDVVVGGVADGLPLQRHGPVGGDVDLGGHVGCRLAVRAEPGRNGGGIDRRWRLGRLDLRPWSRGEWSRNEETLIFF